MCGYCHCDPCVCDGFGRTWDGRQIDTSMGYNPPPIDPDDYEDVEESELTPYVDEPRKVRDLPLRNPRPVRPPQGAACRITTP